MKVLKYCGWLSHVASCSGQLFCWIKIGLSHVSTLIASQTTKAEEILNPSLTEVWK